MLNYVYHAPSKLPMWLQTLIAEFKQVFINDIPATVYKFQDTPITNESNIAKVIDTFGDIEQDAFYKTLINECVYSKRGSILTHEEAVERGCIGKLPPVMTAHFEHIDNRVTSRVTSTTWILWYGSKVSVVHPTPSLGKFKLGSDIIKINDPAQKMPEGVLYAIKVTVGTTYVDGFLRGVTWTHYAK